MVITALQIAFFVIFLLFIVALTSLIVACLYFNQTCMKKETPQEATREESPGSSGDRQRVSYQKRQAEAYEVKGTENRENLQQRTDVNEPPMPQWLFKEHITPPWCTDGKVFRTPIMGTQAMENINTLGRAYEKPESEADETASNGNTMVVTVTIEPTPPEFVEDESSKITAECTQRDASSDMTLPESGAQPHDVPKTSEPTRLPVISEAGEFTSEPQLLSGTSLYSENSGLVSSGSIHSSEIAQLVTNNLRVGKTSPITVRREATFNPYGPYEIFMRTLQTAIRRSFGRKRPESLYQDEIESPKFPITTSTTPTFEFPFTNVLRRDFPEAKILDQLQSSHAKNVDVVDVPESTETEEVKAKEDDGKQPVVIEMPDEVEEKDLGIV